MFNIYVGSTFFEEKKYIVETLFSEFIGVDEYQIFSSKENQYEIRHVESNKVIFLQDDFFNKTQGTYLKKGCLPKGCRSINYQENEISFPFGDNKLIYEKSKIYCGADLFASAFFMLTRWEEVVETEKDKFDRFPEEMSWTVKNNLEHRPLVNEYAKFLRYLLEKLNIDVVTKPKKFEAILSHDIDNFARYDSIRKILRALGGDILARKSLKALSTTILDILKIYVLGRKDNYDTFDYLMDLSDKSGIKSRFYFIPGLMGEFDVRYNYNAENVKKIYKKIKERDHIIGIHPSYNSLLDKELLLKEKIRLEKITGLIIKEGRQHYLRFQVPETWQHWEDVGLEIDGSMGFVNRIGFRTGSCSRYSVFNVITRKKLKLKEDTLHVMDVSLVNKQQDPSDIVETVKKLIKETKEYNGKFSLLWHNNNLFHPLYLKYVKVYESLVEELKTEND